MKARYVTMLGITVLMIGSLMTGAVQALETESSASATRANLENVRYYAPAVRLDTPAYAVDAGVLFAGGPGSWTEVTTPPDIIVGAVAVDSLRPETVYIGAANEMSIYRSTDGGQEWLRVPLSSAAGGVTDVAVDGLQRLIYAGTDTQGVFRLRDVGSSMIVGGQLLIDEPVRQVATDSTGRALAFARTDSALYRADNYGLVWSTVENLHGSPTALAVANTEPATVYVGTVDRGVLTSTDGLEWTMANEGLGALPGARLHVDALALDPVRTNQVYAAASYLHGSTTLHQSPSYVASSADGGNSWNVMEQEITTSVTDLLPVSGMPDAVYALTAATRTPSALFDESALALNVGDGYVAAYSAGSTFAPSGATAPVPLPWLVAALAALALGIFVTYDMYQRGVRPLAQTMPLTALDTQSMPTIG